MARMAWAALLEARPPPTRMYLKCGALMGAISDQRLKRLQGAEKFRRQTRQRSGKSGPYFYIRITGRGRLVIAFRPGARLRRGLLSHETRMQSLGQPSGRA